MYAIDFNTKRTGVRSASLQYSATGHVLPKLQ